MIRPRHVTPTSVEALAARIAEATDAAAELHGDPSVTVTGACLRAHDVAAGELFAALPGAHAHGADFAATALQRGAVAVLTDPEGATREAIAGSGLPVLVHPRPREALGRRHRYLGTRRAGSPCSGSPVPAARPPRSTCSRRPWPRQARRPP